MRLAEIVEPAILIRISKAYGARMSEDELYNTTRGRWKLNPKVAEKGEFAIIVHNGIVKEVFKVDFWQPATRDSGLNISGDVVGRFEFVGKKASDDIRRKYVNYSVRHYFKKGNSNPINYLNFN